MTLINARPTAEPTCFERIPEGGVARFRACRRLVSASVGATLLVTAGCLDRPIGTTKPVTTNVVVQKQANTAITAIDLLLMIDNSSSMADKQNTLAAAVPQLLQQLVQPQCVDGTGAPFNPPVQAALGAERPCAEGSPEFNPVNNIHVGVVTSSLGDHGGGKTCTPDADSQFPDPSNPGKYIPQPPDMDDRAYLVGTLQRGKDALASVNFGENAKMSDQGFLVWGSEMQPHPRDTDLTAAVTLFGDQVKAAGERGCGYEAQLESWFRFLIDPVPPVLPLQPPKGDLTSRQGVDETLLAQRRVFLRPNSLVAIVMLTDENDCSLRDTDVGWVPPIAATIATGSAPCATNPNDPCCYTCTSAAPPKGCSWSCPRPQGNADQPQAIDDTPNLRCWQQKRRFGYEFTYPTSRYSVALTKKELCPDQSFGDMDCDCAYAQSIGVVCDPGTRRLPNPLYSNAVGKMSDGTDVIGYPDAIARSDNSAVFLAGIIGVPWQDISEPDSQPAGKPLQYVPVTDGRWTKVGGIWNQIYADYNDQEKLPLDPRMVESVIPRPGLPGPTAAVGADPIIGHEFNTAHTDLEYACIYRLPTAKGTDVCDPTAANYRYCKSLNPNDCYPPDTQTAEPANKPLCQNPTTGGYSDYTQHFAKGYPGLRELAVLHDYATSAGTGIVSGNSIVASICPKDLDSANDSAGYGYNPAVAALLSRLKIALKGSCLPRPLSPEPDGKVLCNVVEAVTKEALKDSSCSAYCGNMGRNQEPTAENPSGGPSSYIQAAVLDQMKKSKICDSGSIACSNMCLCLLSQESNSANTTGNASGSDLAVCQNVKDGTESTLPPGYCYVDPGLRDAAGNPIAGSNPALVANCPAGQSRILRFVGSNPSGSGPGLHVPVPLPNAFVFTACQGSALTE
jgi:hypothetical protein